MIARKDAKGQRRKGFLGVLVLYFAPLREIKTKEHAQNY